MADARVRIQAEPLAVRSDAQGRFRLPPLTADQRAQGRHVVAWKEGYRITGALAGPIPLAGSLATLLPLLRLPPVCPADRLPMVLTLVRLPSEDSASYRWIDPVPDRKQASHCGNCHAEIYTEWSASGHARSATGRHFRNLYEGTDARGRKGIGWSFLADHPDGAGVCTACHAPTVPFEDPAFFDLRQVKGVSAQGVHCDYCHKIVDAPTTNLGKTHGRFNLQLLRPATGQLFFGPLDDVDREEDAFAAVYRESRYCASCHEGTVFGVHVYGTYSEWLASPARKAGKQCQTCHMAPTGKLTNLAPDKGGIPRDPKTLGNHRFFAGSQADMLRRCLKVSVDLDRSDQEVRARVTLRAEDVGHRVPTGFVDRNLILVVDGRDAEGKPVQSRTGTTLPKAAGRELAGLPGRLYARLLRDFDGHSPAPFWRAEPEAADTRLLPECSEVSRFTFPPRVRRLRVRLLYRRFWQEVAETKGWADNAVTVYEKTIDVVR